MADQPTEYFAVHYTSTVDGKVKKYCQEVLDHCRGCGETGGKHADTCEKPAPIWFDRASWLSCGEIVVASNEASAWASHLTRCKAGK